MSRWPYTKLGSLATFKNGLNFSSDNFGRGLKVIGVTDFQDYFYPKYDEVDEINPNGVVREVDYLEDGDVLFVRSNGNPNLIGRSLFIRNPPEKISHSGFTIRLRFTTDKAFRPFYVYLFKSSLIRSVLSIYGGGTNINNLNQQILCNLDVPLPPLAVQKNIAAILSAYDELIENNQRRIALLEKLAEEIYREWFVRLRFPGHEKVKRVKGVPAGWSVQPASEAFRVMGGGTPKTEVAVYWDGEIPFFTPKDSHVGFYVLNTEKTLTEKGLQSCSSQLFPSETIFITARGTVGELCLAHRPMAMNQSCYALAPRGEQSVYFHFLAMKLAITYIKGISKSGVFDNIVIDTFKNVPIMVPTTDLLRSFNEMAKPIFGQIGCLLQTNVHLTATRDQLLPRLISGKLSVENLDIQFPPGMAEELNAAPTATPAGREK